MFELVLCFSIKLFLKDFQFLKEIMFSDYFSPKEYIEAA